MLSELSSVYDPLGLASPFILKGRRITQKLCQGIVWDCCYTLCSNGITVTRRVRY